ncbi:hypothetical protein A2690_03980 [Candidatus Roizmanbacteria bacterium RIFCSPHIGHO2_01_FULL_39_12b]|uniref:50S ribosomal protein L29 n=1 Tax=Candidatus Roizmanbacteria bacterium RIFCSPHIGHO2_01_FULL_39_12b TaxID=1802030 RepID=A0A1F7GC10_9BACT|nr:MAG: hypothetical protein A2690_03980 [Candidatus Roizmanbacteria bacterium RIFCSPHIGHO2_01_FULL_39_12b]OGK47100.1 MAG: hypothetical protein A3B46_01705 [Candidatus Roizmanbacteria bacterium RIFCSPLOWO2_01_FULL_39_19]
MKRDTKRKIWEKDVKTLEKEIIDLRTEIAHDILTFSTSKPKDVNLISNKKQKLAIMSTALNEKKQLRVFNNGS